MGSSKVVASAVLVALTAVYVSVDASTVASYAALTPPLVVNVLLSLVAYMGTSYMTVAMMPVFIKARLYGIDLNKPQTKRDADGVLIRPYDGPIVPEAMGAVACTVYLVCMFAFIPFPFMHDIASWGAASGGTWRTPTPTSAAARSAAALAAPYSFPHAHLSMFLCALLAICCMCFLGFADDVLDLRWRDRLWLPLFASLPLLMVYAVDGGGTVIVVPKFLVALLGASSIKLGIAYYLFMACLAIFCTNSINILAGGAPRRLCHRPSCNRPIPPRVPPARVPPAMRRLNACAWCLLCRCAVNGLEVGQAVVIAATVLVNNAIQLWRWPEGPLHDNNLFSLYLVLPFLGCSLALLRHNWYPSKVFVGDTYCYFAGMTFAVAGILGHNTKTMLLFFVPQVVNFLYSVPQLFRLIPCPRHRMPAFLPKTNQLTNSFADIEPSELGSIGKLILGVVETFRLAKVVRTPGSTVVQVSNFTIINYALYVCGPMHEASLTTLLLGVQVVCNVLALLVRYQLAGLFYDVVR